MMRRVVFREEVGHQLGKIIACPQPTAVSPGSSKCLLEGGIGSHRREQSNEGRRSLRRVMMTASEHSAIPNRFCATAVQLSITREEVIGVKPGESFIVEPVSVRHEGVRII